MNLDNNTEELKNEKKITGLKVAKYALNALTSVASLVKTPITTGVAIAAELGSILTEAILDKEETKETLAIAK